MHQANETREIDQLLESFDRLVGIGDQHPAAVPLLRDVKLAILARMMDIVVEEPAPEPE